MNVGTCLPQMWAFRWGVVQQRSQRRPRRREQRGYVKEGARDKKTCQASDEVLASGRVTCSAPQRLDQTQLFCSSNSRPAIVDVEFAVDAFGMCADRAQADHELTSDLGSRELGSE